MADRLLRVQGMERKRILAAISSPGRRDVAFARALAIARSSGAELHLLHAVPAAQRFSLRAAERLERFEEMRRRAEDAGVAVRAVEQHGDPAGVIGLHANARDMDLIVMGDVARGGWGRYRTSVAERIVRRSDVPTLVLASDGPEGLPSFRTVLVAVDLSPASNDVVARAIELTADEAVELTLIHAVTGVEAADAVQSRARWVVPEYRAHVLNDARQKLEAIASAAAGDVGVGVRVSAGPAARTILEQADHLNADLIVVGRSRGIKLLGSTALRVLRRTDRALLVIPSAATSTRGVRTRAA